MNLQRYLRLSHMTQAHFAEQLGVTQGAISQWLNTGIPAKRVLQIEALTGGVVCRHALRPDLYPPVPAASRASGSKNSPEDILVVK